MNPVNPTGSTTWSPKVCKIMALRAILRGLGLLSCILLGFRYVESETPNPRLRAFSSAKALYSSLLGDFVTQITTCMYRAGP